MRDSELASLAGRRDGEINNVVVRLAGKSSQVKTALENSVRAELESLFGGQPGLAIYSRTQTASGGVVDANINGGFSIAMFFSGVFLLGTLPVTSVLLARMVEGERQRIGTLRALGVTRRELIQHYLAFGLIIGVTGGLTGSVLGYLNSFWVMDTFIRYLAGGTLPGFANHPQLPFILLGFVIVVLGSTFAGAYPAWVQSATPPGIALRPMVPKMPNALSRARLRLLPPVLRRVVRNMLRVPGRSLSTALGVVAGAMMIFSSFALWDTLQSNFKDYFGSSAFDLRIDMSTLQPAGPLEAQVRAIPGVQAAQGALVGPVTILRADGSLFETAAVVIDERDPFFDLRTLDGAPAFSRADGVWIGHNTRRVLGVDAGDTLTLRAFGQERQVQVLGVVSYTLGGPLFIPRGLLVQWTPNAVFPVNAALVRVPAGQAAPMRDALVDLPGMRAVTVLSDYDADVNHYLNWFRAGTLIFGGFGYILTLAVLFNTVNGGLRERHDELAILRALGSSRREIALMVTLELLAMVVLGAVIGVPVGRAMGFWLTHTYDTDFFGQVNVLRPHYYVVGLLSLVIVVLLAELPGLRAVQRADLGQISKSQSF
jgi:putative ABC transport system permease protein